jgi:hypothetical protein
MVVEPDIPPARWVFIPAIHFRIWRTREISCAAAGDKVPIHTQLNVEIIAFGATVCCITGTAVAFIDTSLLQAAGLV